RRTLRFVIARAERFHRREPAQTNRDNGGFRTAREEEISVTKFDDAPGLTDCVARRRAGCDDAHVRAAQIKLHRDEPACHVADEHRNGESRDTRWPFGEEGGVLVFERFQSADATAKEHPETVTVD